MSETEPYINIQNQEESLVIAGYTVAGMARFKSTVQDYCGTVFRMAVAYADVQKENGLPREVTHEHVRSAAVQISQRPVGSKKWLFIQALEYVFTATAGIGAGHLDQSWGILVFVISTALAVLIFVLRKINT